MGNKNSIYNNSHDKDNKNFLKELNAGISNYLKLENAKKKCLDNKNKNNDDICIFTKVLRSNLGDHLESNHILEFCMEITSSLIGRTLNHEVNSNFYKSLSLQKISENIKEVDIFYEKNPLIIDWIYNNKTFDNWLPENKEYIWHDKLNRVSSIYPQSDSNNISTYNLTVDDNKHLSNSLRKKKITNNKISLTERGKQNKNEDCVLTNDNISKINFKKKGRVFSADKIKQQRQKKNKKKKPSKFLSDRFLLLNRKHSGSNSIKSQHINTSPGSRTKRMIIEDQKLNKKKNDEINFSINNIKPLNSASITEKLNLKNEANVKDLKTFNPSSERNLINQNKIIDSYITKKSSKDNGKNQNIIPGRETADKNEMQNLNINLNKKISDAEELKHSESIKPKYPSHRLNSQNISKNNTYPNAFPIKIEDKNPENFNNLKSINLEGENNKQKANHKDKNTHLNKKPFYLDKDRHTPKKVMKRTDSNIKIFLNRNVSNVHNDMQSNHDYNNINNPYRKSKPSKNSVSKQFSRENLKSDVIPNIIKPLLLKEDFNINKNSKNDLKINKPDENMKMSMHELNTKQKNMMSSSPIVEVINNKIKSKNKLGKSIKIDIRDLLKEEELKNKEVSVHMKYRKPFKDQFPNNNNTFQLKKTGNSAGKRNNQKKKETPSKSIQNKESINLNHYPENYLKESDFTLEQLRDLCENPKSQGSKIIIKKNINNNENTINKVTNNINLNEQYNKIKTQNPNFKRLNFNNQNFDPLACDYKNHTDDLLTKNEMTKLKDYIMNLNPSDQDIDLQALDLDLPYNEIIKHFKENNKFLFEMTNEEKELNIKLKTLKYVNFDETLTENMNINPSEAPNNEKSNHNFKISQNLEKDKDKLELIERARQE